MRGPLLRWLLIGVAVAAVTAVVIVVGLLMIGPRKAPPAPAAVADVAETISSEEPRLADGELLPEPVATPAPKTSHDYVILQIGDSHTAADLFSGEVRDKLQDRFGKGGLFLPPGIPKAGVQSADITIKASDGWSYNAMASTDQPEHFWLSGYTASVTENGASISFASKSPRAFDAIDVSFLKSANGGAADILLDGVVVNQVNLNGKPGEPLIRRLLPAGKTGQFTRLEVKTTSAGKVEFSGVFVDQRQSGVSYLSVGFPSARVNVLERMAPENLADDMQRINPDMVVLAFGTNEGFDDNLDIARYKTTLTGIVNALMRARPGLRVVLIGPPPGARQESSCTEVRRACGQPVAGACWAQPRNIAAVRAAEQAVAKELGATFWDWSSVLPTACDLEQGHLGNPAVFGPDRVHLTARGYRNSADAFAQVLVPIVTRAMGS